MTFEYISWNWLRSDQFYEFLCFMNFAPANKEFCFFTAVVDLFPIWTANVATFYEWSWCCNILSTDDIPIIYEMFFAHNFGFFFGWSTGRDLRGDICTWKDQRLYRQRLKTKVDTSLFCSREVVNERDVPTNKLAVGLSKKYFIFWPLNMDTVDV